MSLGSRSHNLAWKSILVLSLMAIPVFAWGQHEKESKEPPARPSKPSHPSNSNKGRPTGNQGNRPAQNNRGARPTGEQNNRPGNTPNRPVNSPGNRVGNGPNNRGGNPGGNRGNAPANRVSVASRPAPGRNVNLRGGGTASLRPNGQIRSINRNGMQIHNNLRGGRTVVSERNGVRIVTTDGGRGYVQRAYVVRGGHSYYSRTYYDHGVYRVGVYRGYYYGGYHYYGYYPGYWYHPGFYGWAYRPWGPPIAWGIGIGGWGWAGTPWFGFYGGFFAPYPVYPSAAFWLTDYLIAANLQAAYAAQAANADAAAGYDPGPANYSDNGGGQTSNSSQVVLTPEVKQAIAEEVRAQLADQQQQSGAQGSSPDAQMQPAAPSPAPASTGNEVPPALDPARRTFVVYSDITVSSDGQECELTAGDVLTRLTDTPDADQKVNASVQASKKSDCAAGKQVAVSVEDLQDMHNHFQEQLDNGMKALAEKQGTGGMPKAPDTGTTASDVPPPQPDTNAAKDLADQQAAADQAEAQVKQETAEGPGGGQQQQ